MNNVEIDKPKYRKLRGYAFDPSLSLKIDTVDINNITYKVNWEDFTNQSSKRSRKLNGNGPGPIGEYLEVIDYDPTINQFYSPVNLDDPGIIAKEGLSPSESNPQFHQQMVYAVGMVTIQNFEKALGRKILWAPRLLEDSRKYCEYVPRLRIYPHALREANAFYSAEKKALLFGYFAASPADITIQMPNTLVFTCLSHDIIAHEMTHAILDGLHVNYNKPTNPDVLAFHEAFADIVALFQHFSFPDVLKHQIAKTKGDLNKQNILGQLAQQFGTAVGNYGSLRDAIGEIDEKTKQWKPIEPDPQDYKNTVKPHDRGSILVAAVFEAFLTIYQRRIRDLYRIASNGTGVLPEGEIHPDLVNRLVIEASKTSKHILNMCIRAIDYCPPVDITFGDYLRAIITADCDVVDEDIHYYRIAFIDAFRRRGIYPNSINTLSIESLRYPKYYDDLNPDTKILLEIISDFLRDYHGEIMYETNRRKIFEKSAGFISGRGEYKGLHSRIGRKFKNSFEFEKLTGLILNNKWKEFGVRTSKATNGPSFQVLNLRLVSRIGPDGNQINQIIFGLVQRIGLVYKNGEYQKTFTPTKSGEIPKGGMEVQGGCTLIFDLDTRELKYAITKPLLDPDELDNAEHVLNHDRFKTQKKFQTGVLPFHVSDTSAYFGEDFQSPVGAPFSYLHG